MAKSQSPAVQLPGNWLLDASIYIFHAWFGIPDHFHDRHGRSINALFGFSKTLTSLLLQRPQRLVCAFDESLFSGIRHELDPDYKCSRLLPDDELAYQLHSCREFAQCLGLPSLASDRYEADDLLASARSQWFENQNCTVITADKDLAQMMRPGDIWWHPARDDLLDLSQMEQRWGVPCDRLADLLALMGDKVDDIPGVPGVGAKTAAALINHFGSLSALLDSLDLIAEVKVRGASKLAVKIEPLIDRLRLNLQLTTLYQDAPLPEVPITWHPDQVNWSELDKKLQQWRLPSTVLKQIEALKDW